MGRMATFDLLRLTGSSVVRLARVPGERREVRGVDGLVLGRLLGTASGSSTARGFDLQRWAFFGVWEDLEAAEDFWSLDRLGRGWRAAAEERWSATLRPRRSHGSWAGVEPFGAVDLAPGDHGGQRRRSDEQSGQRRRSDEQSGQRRGSDDPGDRGGGGQPVAVLTRATVRARRLRRFRRARSPVDEEVHQADGMLAVVGMGEWPVGQQATFSLWRDDAAARAFAFNQPAHADVVRRTRAERWYGDEMFTTFSVVGHAGSWDGRDPLAVVIRPAHAGDVAGLASVERGAAQRFAGMGLADLDDVIDPEMLHEGVRRQRLWVAEEAGSVVGFALATVVDGQGFLREVDVAESHGRRGMGTRLVEAVVACSREQDHTNVTLTTFRDVPWNEPWYRRLGFRPVPEDDHGPELTAIVERERAAGLTRRIVMRLTLSGPTTAASR